GVVDPAMADDLMTAGMKFRQRIGKVFGDTAIGIDGTFDAVTVERVHDAPDASLAAVFAVGKRRIVRLAVFAAPILGGFIERFEGDKKADGDLRVVRPLDWFESHSFDLSRIW